MAFHILNQQMLHGADYNPDQWLDRPDILEKDIALMKRAHVNCASVGIFAWAALEPEEGVYTFDWLEGIINSLYENGIYTILATPSGARPVWMAQKHPEVLRVGSDLVRNQMGGRHNHCYTSPYYRQKVWDINKALSQRFGKHQGVILWHLSNEYGGDCYCPLCQAEFRLWLKKKYGTLDGLNRAWWTSFWSHTYTDWAQIEPPLPKGEMGVHGLVLDWRRFVTDRTLDFCAWEKAAVRAGGSELPVTANFMDFFYDLNYHKFRDVVDIVSWDSYPQWHNPDGDDNNAIHAAMCHDLMRSIKKAPFLLMESTPSNVNWRQTCRIKAPGMHQLSSLQAVAHGSNSVQYFQWRKSRGSSEKFHGAVVGHDGTASTRTFQEVATLGETLEGLSELCKTNVLPQVAIVYDWENHWAIDQAQALHNGEGAMRYQQTLQQHYAAFWRMGIHVDIVDMSCDLSGYKLVVAPMLYMYREDILEKLRSFVAKGGTLVSSYWTGLVDENDLCFESLAPYGMHDVFGLKSDEIDALFPNQHNATVYGNKRYKISHLCDIVSTSDAEVLCVYQEDFYAGKPVLTKNTFGNGTAYYLCAAMEDSFYVDFYAQLAEDLQLEKALDAQLPANVTTSLRKGANNIAIVQNFNRTDAQFTLRTPVKDFYTGEKVSQISLKPYEVRLFYV